MYLKCRHKMGCCFIAALIFVWLFFRYKEHLTLYIKMCKIKSKWGEGGYFWQNITKIAQRLEIRPQTSMVSGSWGIWAQSPRIWQVGLPWFTQHAPLWGIFRQKNFNFGYTRPPPLSKILVALACRAYQVMLWRVSYPAKKMPQSLNNNEYNCRLSLQGLARKRNSYWSAN